jgi:hypothetical protein
MRFVPALPWPEERTLAFVPPLVRVVLEPRTVAPPTVRLPRRTAAV